MKLKGLLALSFIPLILTGCSSAMTPSFGDSSDSIENSQSASPSENPSAESSKGSQQEGHKGNQSKDENKVKQTEESKEDKKEVSSQEKTGGTDKSSKNDKEDNLKLDENGIPVFDGKNSEIDIPREMSEGDSNTKNTTIYDPKSSDLDTAVKVGNEYIKNVKGKKWKQACGHVYKVDGQNCSSNLEFIYKNGNNFVEYKRDNITGVVLSKKSMSVSIKDKGYEDSQRMTFIQQDGAWKIFIKQ